MKNAYSILLLTILLPFLSSGCFEIREEVNMKADGSGEVLVVFNLSKSKGRLRQYMTMEKVESYRVPSKAEVESLLLQVKNTMRVVEGITYAEAKSDWSNFIFQFNARFDNLTALNKAITLLSRQLEFVDMPPVTQANFEYGNGIFHRFFDYPPNPEDFARLPSIQRLMLESSQMIGIYRFEKSVKSTSHAKSILSPSGKSVMLKMPLSQLLTGTGSLENTITFED